MELGTRGDSLPRTATSQDAAVSGFHRMPTDVILQTVASLISCRGCLLSIARISDTDLAEGEQGGTSFNARLLKYPFASFPEGYEPPENTNSSHVLQAVLMRQQRTVWVLSVLRSEDDEPFTKADAALVHKLRPTFAMLLSKSNDIANPVDRLAWAILDRFRVGVVVMDLNGIVVASNEKARKLLQQDYGMTIAGRQLCMSSLNEAGKFRDALVRVSSAENPTIRALTFDADNGSKLQIHLLKIASRDGFGGATPVSIAAIIRDPQRDSQPETHILNELYGLTRMESELVVALAGGMSIAESAAKLKVSTHTARGYLKIIFRKTGARRQSDIVRLAAAASEL